MADIGKEHPSQPMRRQFANVPDDRFNEEYYDTSPKPSLEFIKNEAGLDAQNIIMFYFNTLEDVGDLGTPGGAANRNINNPNWVYHTLAGKFTGQSTTKNRAYQSILQDEAIDTLTKTPPKTDANGIIGQVAKSVTSYLRRFKRVDISFALFMPQSIRYSSGANWQAVNADPNAIGLIGGAGMAEGNALKNLGSIFGREAVGNVADALVEGEVGNAVTKSVQNTWNDMTFGGMQRRSFQFNWTFSPKSLDEVREIDNIIQLLRFQAHPSLSAIGFTGSYLDFPGQVDVEWYTKPLGEDDYIENAWLPKISTCVIESIETDYTANQFYSFFNRTGSPTTINLSVNLTEIHPLLKTDIARGL